MDTISIIALGAVEYAPLQRLYSEAVKRAKRLTSGYKHLDDLRRSVVLVGMDENDMYVYLLQHPKLTKADVEVCRLLAERICDVVLMAFCKLAKDQEWA